MTAVPNRAYSTAPRCPHCVQRAALSERGAATLASFTGGRLVAYACPHGNGWHVDRTPGAN